MAKRLDRNLRVADRLALVVLAPERGSGRMAVVTLSHDVDSLLSRLYRCPTLAMVVPHALRARPLVELAIQTTGVAIELVVEPAPPKRGVSGTTV